MGDQPGKGCTGVARSGGQGRPTAHPAGPSSVLLLSLCPPWLPYLTPTCCAPALRCRKKKTNDKERITPQEYKALSSPGSVQSLSLVSVHLILTTAPQCHPWPFTECGVERLSSLPWGAEPQMVELGFVPGGCSSWLRKHRLLSHPSVER